MPEIVVRAAVQGGVCRVQSTSLAQLVPFELIAAHKHTRTPTDVPAPGFGRDTSRKAEPSPDQEAKITAMARLVVGSCQWPPALRIMPTANDACRDEKIADRPRTSPADGGTGDSADVPKRARTDIRRRESVDVAKPAEVGMPG